MNTKYSTVMTNNKFWNVVRTHQESVY